jgi:hypothetical protein
MFHVLSEQKIVSCTYSALNCFLCPEYIILFRVLGVHKTVIVLLTHTVGSLTVHSRHAIVSFMYLQLCT